MPRPMPNGTEVVTRYDDIRWYSGNFADGRFNYLMIVGPAGVGKTEVMKRSVGDRVFWIEGQSTPFAVYCDLFERRHKKSLNIVLNDAQSLWDRKSDQGGSGISLLKQLCESRKEKILSWQSKAADRAEVPQSFHLSCNVASIANDWLPRNAHSKALEDRAHKLFFNPPAVEVHRYVGTWFDDTEIYDFIEARIDLFMNLSSRLYLLARERKAAGRRPDGEDWKDFIIRQTILAGPSALVARILADPRNSTTQDQEQAFIELGGGSRSTFFEHLRRIRERFPALQRAGLSDCVQRTRISANLGGSNCNADAARFGRDGTCEAGAFDGKISAPRDGVLHPRHDGEQGLSGIVVR
jgi:hypothetical protein